MLRPTCEFLDHDGPIPIAHRGGMGENSQNTTSAIEHCAALGFYVETDVSVTADGVPVLWHPQGADRIRPSKAPRLPGGTRALHTRDLAAMRENGEQTVPLLRDVLGSLPELRLLIDVKQHPGVGPTAKAIAETDAVNRVSIGTFSQARTGATARRLFELTGKHVCTAIGPMESARLAVHAVVAPDVPWMATGNSAQLPYRQVARRVVVAAHSAAMAVLPWTVNEESDMNRMLDLGVDGLMTDFPTRLQAVLSRRK